MKGRVVDLYPRLHSNVSEGEGGVGSVGVVCLLPLYNFVLL